MTKDALFNALVAVTIALGGGVCALVIYVVRMAARWASVETRLDALIGQVTKLVSDQDMVHRDILATMREDRLANNQRLRWLEENLWKTQQST